jgi:hypothetical protein
MRTPTTLLCLAVALLPAAAAGKPRPSNLPPPVALTEPLPASACDGCRYTAQIVAGSAGADFLAAWNVFAGTSFQSARRVIDANGNGGMDTAITPTAQVFVVGAAGLGDSWVLAWSNPGRVFVQWLDGNGMPSGSSVQVNPTDLGDNHGTSLAGGAGRLLATFDANLPTGATLMGQLLDEGLELVGGPVALGPATSHAPTAACFRPDGSAVVAWTTWNRAPTGPDDVVLNGVALRVLGADGAPRGPVQILAAPKLAVRVQPTIACTGGNGYVVAWHTNQKPLANRSWEVVGHWVDGRGKDKGAFQLNVDQRGDQLLPSLLGLSNGAVLAVWESWSGDSNRLVGRYFSAAGQPRGNEFVLHTAAPGAQARSPRLTLLPGTGRFVLAWQEDERGWVQIFAE